MESSVKPLDALHLSAAEKGEAVYFCTCDDQLYKKAKAIDNLNVNIISPIDLLREVEK